MKVTLGGFFLEKRIFMAFKSLFLSVFFLFFQPSFELKASSSSTTEMIKNYVSLNKEVFSYLATVAIIGIAGTSLGYHAKGGRAPLAIDILASLNSLFWGLAGNFSLVEEADDSFSIFFSIFNWFIVEANIRQKKGRGRCASSL